MSEPAPPSPPPGLSTEDARAALRRGIATAVIGLVALALAVAVLAQSPIGADAVADLVARSSLPHLAAAWAIMSSAFVFMAFRWRVLMPAGHRPPIPGLTAILSAGLLLNYAVPGPVGELGAAWFAHRRYGVPLPGALASGVTARALGLATSAVMAALIWVGFDLPVPPGYESIVGVAAAVIGSAGLALGAVAARPKFWQRLVERVLGRLSGPSRLGRLAERLTHGVGALTLSFADVIHRGGWAWLKATAWAAAGHTAVIGSILIAVEGLGADASMAGMAFTYATTTAGAVALFALPGSQLGWDALFVALLVGTTGLPLGDAVAIAALVRAQQLSMMGLGGVAVAWLVPGALRGPSTA